METPPLPSPGDAAVDLSVVFVTRNEAERIEQCVRSTMEAVEEARKAGVVRAPEYILVDSASTDRTVEIAAKFPLRILLLEASWPLSCAAGCHIGLLHARGEFVAIINGDMTIDRRYFADTLPRMTPEIGAICGVANEELGGRTVAERLVIRYSAMALSEGVLPSTVARHHGGYSAGSLLVRAEAARQVGSYNPFFVAAEDMDLRHRLLAAGWKVLNLPIFQGTHYWASREEPLTIVQYFRTILRNSTGLGQMARYNLPRDSANARQAVRPVFNGRTLMQVAAALGLLAIASAHVLAALTSTVSLLILLVTCDAIAAGLLARRSRSLEMGFRDYLFSVTWYPAFFAVTRVTGFVRGFLRTPRGPESYPTRAQVLGGSPRSIDRASG